MTIGSIGGTYGLSGSGMDIDAIVKKLMTGQQAKADALLQKKTIAQWQKAAYNSMYVDINNFRTTLFDYKLQGTLSPNKVSSSNPSNTSVATVSASADAADVNHSLVVAQLADGIKLTSTASLSPAGTTIDRTSIATQLYAGVAINDISVTITNGSSSTTIAVNPNGTLNDFVSQINNAGINVTANYDSTLDRFFLTTNNSGSNAAISFAGSNASGMTFLDKLKLPLLSGSNISSSSQVQTTLAYINPALSLGSQFTNLTNSTLKLTNSNGTTQIISIGTGNSLNDLMGAINAGTNATASFDSTTGKFSITPTNGGTLSIDGSDQSAKDLFAQLHLPANFNSGKVTTSITGVYTPVAFNAGSALNTQFGEFSTFTSGQTFTLKIATGTDTPTSVTIDPTVDSLNSMLTKISSVTNVSATYDSTTGKVMLSSTNGKSLNFTGSDAAGTSFLVNTLKLQQSGHDAVFKLDGVSLTEASNSFNISGVTYNLTGVSTNAAMLSTSVMDTTVGEVTNISVTSDVDKAVASIQSLVDSYNKILAEVNGKLNETRYKDYLPLTDDQKAAMKDSDITAWNAKAQSGMLHNDTTLTSLVNSMRNAFSGPVSGIPATNVNGSFITYNSAASIGITTGDYTEGGKLYLDTNKLRTALQANPNVLNQLFGASGQTTTGGVTTTDTQKQGIAGRLYDGIKTSLDQLVEIAGASAQIDTKSNYAKKISDYTKQISNQADRFSTMESAYYKKFNAMEVALQQMNSQSSWLSSQLSSIGG
ncbi:flagellar filament capping protein FliD [Desulfitobacterium metallireducens]|uniref:Flagellar hook-associated protein 2 n=1 Tax=Desulfitobacterium metallireducens DSM 15288 TaxID=871968 RepID=W0EF34_9FIRM|nr:flagellar filament capping protein FliD [Desulfitobacterium metallireducens]AHF07799.1 flagellar hook protein [Desulfitobacterium metallireducens DSM 15288]